MRVALATPQGDYERPRAIAAAMAQGPEQKATLLAAVNAAAARDEELLRAVEASAARDDAILAAVEAGATRDADLKQQVQGLSDSLRRKTKKEAVRQLKDAQLERYERQLDYVEDEPFATVWTSNFGRPTPSTRRAFCAMT